MSKIYKSDILRTTHESASDLFGVGLIDKKTMRDFDESCLTEVKEMAPQDIKRLREREAVSQTVLARYLNVSINVVSQWERGEKKPAGSSLKLLNLVDKKGLASIQ